MQWTEEARWSSLETDRRVTSPGFSVRGHSASIGTLNVVLEDMTMCCEITTESDRSKGFYTVMKRYRLSPKEPTPDEGP